ncbi:MAG: signal peptidase I [Candidatus Moranbacteria bacterium]|nr:signal peptidase I [Candidatus Moranbacteria bacterium]
MKENLESKENKLKKTVNIVGNIFVVIVIFLALFLIISVVLPKFSYNLFAIKTGSMEPTIKTGSAVITKSLTEYSKDDIITFNDFNRGLITHRINKVIEKNGKNEKFETKGDDNDNADRELVEKNVIKGKVILKIPFLGYLIMWAKQPLGIVILFLIPAGWLIGGEILKIKKISNKRKN